jgi:hypothetical protein
MDERRIIAGFSVLGAVGKWLNRPLVQWGSSPDGKFNGIHVLAHHHPG